jgi:hypothetical protein
MYPARGRGMSVFARLGVVGGSMVLAVGGLAAPAQADYYSYVDTLEANGLLLYAKPPRCAPPSTSVPMDWICPQVDKFYSADQAYDVGRIRICDYIQGGGTRAGAIESLTMFQGIKYTEAAAEAIYDIAVTHLCWQ